MYLCIYIFFNGRTARSRPGSPHYRCFTITLRHTQHSVGLPWTSDQPVAETSSWKNTHERETSALPAGFGMVWVPFHASGIYGKQSGTRTYFFMSTDTITALWYNFINVLPKCLIFLIRFWHFMVMYVERHHVNGGCLKAGLSNYNALEGHTVRDNSSVGRTCAYL